MDKKPQHCSRHCCGNRPYNFMKHACSDISKTTIERTLTEFVKNDYIAKVGSGPTTGYDGT